MAYSTINYVKDEFKALTTSATSVITDAKITRFIEEVDAYIDSRLATYYVTPVTASTALPILRMISIYMVAQRIKNILMDSPTTRENVKIEFPADLDKKGEKYLESFIPKKGEITPTIVLPGASILPSSPTSQGVFAVGSQESDRVFYKSKDTW